MPMWGAPLWLLSCPYRRWHLERTACLMCCWVIRRCAQAIWSEQHGPCAAVRAHYTPQKPAMHGTSSAQQHATSAHKHIHTAAARARQRAAPRAFACECTAWGGRTQYKSNDPAQTPPCFVVGDRFGEKHHAQNTPHNWPRVPLIACISTHGEAVQCGAAAGAARARSLLAV